jgi:predicted transcriptional regulator
MQQAREIRERYALGGISQAALAGEYGVTQTAVSSIVLYRRRLEPEPAR